MTHEEALAAIHKVSQRLLAFGHYTESDKLLEAHEALTAPDTDANPWRLATLEEPPTVGDFVDIRPIDTMGDAAHHVKCLKTGSVIFFEMYGANHHWEALVDDGYYWRKTPE